MRIDAHQHYWKTERGDYGWLTPEQGHTNLELAVRDECPIDLQLRPRHLPYMLEALRAFPTLKGVIDHAAKPFIAEKSMDPYVHHVVEVFGTDRIMFGSDWPVCLATCSYKEVYDALLRALPPNLSQYDVDAFFGGNAKRFYDLH